MRRIAPVVIALIVAVACGTPAGPSAESSTTPTAPSPTASSTASSSASSSGSSPEASSPTTSLPTTSTVVGGDDPAAAALGVLQAQWSTVELWGDGWVEIAATASGAPIPGRDSELGRLFPPEVHDAIEAAGATDMVGAHEALGSAGLVDAALASLREHPEAWDTILAGPAGLRMTASTTIDGQTWTEQPLPFLGSGSPLGTASTGDRLIVVFARPESAPDTTGTDLVAAWTDDLVDWSTATLDPGRPTIGAALDISPVPDGWIVLSADGQSGDPSGAWIIGDGGPEPVAGPARVACCDLEPTDAGVLAWTVGTDGPSRLWHSPDGRSWEPRDVPGATREITTVAAVDDAVVLTALSSNRTFELWRGTADGRGWAPVELPEEIPWPIAVTGRHHRGVAQHVIPPGWGQRGYVAELPPYTFEILHDRVRVEFGIGEQLTVRVTDLATGELRYERSAAVELGVPEFAIVEDGEMSLLDGDDVVYALPMVEVEQARQDAMVAAQDAAAAARSSAEAAFEEGRYLLFSADGITWRSHILEPVAGDLENFRQFASSINGDRALLYWDDATFRVVDLGD